VGDNLPQRFQLNERANDLDKTLRMDEDPLVKRAIEEERKLYPQEYARRARVDRAKRTALQRRIRLFQTLSIIRFQRMASCCRRISVETPSARNDRHNRLGTNRLSLLNRIPRRVSASSYAG